MTRPHTIFSNHSIFASEQRDLPRRGQTKSLIATGALVALFAVVLSGCGEGKSEGAAKAAKADEGGGHSSLVQSAVVGPEDTPSVISGSGTVSAWQEAPVGAEVGGLTAVALAADEGQYVKKGQPLLMMNDVLLQAQLKQAKAQADNAQKAYGRAKELLDKGYLSPAALDQALANQQTTQAALQMAQTNLSLATVRAPVSGLIVSRKAVLGQIVVPGAELFRIVRDGRIELNMEVPESQLSKISAGQNAEVFLEGGKVVTGTVRIVTSQVDPATRLGVARISVPWSSGLRPGMFARASLSLGSTGQLAVPQKAVIYRQNNPGVYIIGADMKARYTEITTGDVRGDKIVVISGLNSGERVVTTGAGFLNDGDQVKIAPTTQAGAR